MKFFFSIQFLGFALMVFVLAVSCADIDTETSGYASLQINLHDVSHRKASRSQMAPSMTHSDANTILAVLVPAVQCNVSTAISGVEYSRSLVDTSTHKAQFVVPLDTQIKLCLYFFREIYSLSDLGTGAIAPEGFGESEIFFIDSNTTSKMLTVEFWTTSYSTVTLIISSTDSAGMLAGSIGTAKLISTTGNQMDNETFTLTDADNESKSVEFSNVVYSSYSYEVELQGFIPANEAFLVSSATEAQDVKLTPNYVELDWFSFEDIAITQQGSSAYTHAGGTLVLNVPIEKKDNVTQVISLMQAKRVMGSTFVDVTPPIGLSSWDNETEGTDNVTYRTSFTTASLLPLDHGSNEIQVILTVNAESRAETIGTVSYDACVDNNTMCLTLFWDSGHDPDLHSYYFPDWTYQEEDNSSFDNTSRGTRHWVYSNDAYKEYTETGQTIQLYDAQRAPDNETQVWATDSLKVGNGTYLVYVDDVSEADVQNFKLVLTGPGITDNKTYGPYDFKDDDNDSTTEATDPQAVFFIQVENNTIKRSDTIPIGRNLDNLSSTLIQWTGSMENSSL